MVDLGTLPGGTYSTARAVSANGLVIVGESETTGGDVHAIKYVNGTKVDLGTLPGGTYATAYAVSADGSVIVGDSDGTNIVNHAFKYVNGSMVDLGTLGGTTSTAYGISADGTVIVGSSKLSNNQVRAFAYTNGTMTNLGTLGGTSSEALGVSADGTVIVGYSILSNNEARAFRYTNGAMTNLGTLPGGTDSRAYGISADGSVIVGSSGVAGGNLHAFKYANDSMIDLGTLTGGTYAYALGASAHGTVIVGYSNVSGGDTHAFKYANGVMTDLGTLTGGTYAFATGVSADGSVIVGYSQVTGGDFHAFVLRGARAVDVVNTYSALASNQSQLSGVLNLQTHWLTRGLDHDCRQFGDRDVCVSAGGSYSHTHAPSGARTAAHLNLAYRANPQLRVGAFVDQGIHTTTPDNFSVKNAMPLMGLFTGWSAGADGVGPDIRASVAYGRSNVDIRRTQLTDTEAGVGNTKLSSQAAQLEGGWGFRLNTQWTAQPFAGLRWSSVRRNGYQETSGADFPISYADVTQKATTGFIGTRLNGQLSPVLSTQLALGVEQDFSQRLSKLEGSIDTLGAFSVDAPQLRRTRGFAKASLNYAVGPMAWVNVALQASQNALGNGMGYAAMASLTLGY